MARYGQQIDDTGIIWPGAFGLMLKKNPDPIQGWVLDSCIDLKPWIGRSVRIQGERYDFNAMIVRSIEPIDGLPPPPEPPIMPWQIARIARAVWRLVRKVSGNG